MGNTPVVSLQHAQKAFGNNAVLKDISLTVEQGDVLSIIGPSGRWQVYTSAMHDLVRDA